MLRVSKLLMKAKEAPKAFEGGLTGAENPPRTDPTKIPGGKATGGPKAPPSSAAKTPSCGHRSPDNGGMVYGHEKTGGMLRVSKLLAQWVNVEADQVEDFQSSPMPEHEQSQPPAGG